MRKLEIDELRKVQLGILDALKDFCEQNGLTYWLDRGSLIGAVRHKGYIPWDDDIDTGMMREDFDFFIRNFKSPDGRYKILNVKLDPDAPYAYAKLCDTRTFLNEKGMELAVNIDIWPYDEIPDSTFLRSKMFAVRKACFYLDRLRKQTARPNGNILRRCVVYAGRLAVRPFPLGWFSEKTVDSAVKYRGSGSDTVGNMMTPAGTICKKSLFASFLPAEFEGRTVSIPAGYDELLTGLYGDYMTLPPENERETHHVIEAYAKD